MGTDDTVNELLNRSAEASQVAESTAAREDVSVDTYALVKAIEGLTWAVQALVKVERGRTDT